MTKEQRVAHFIQKLKDPDFTVRLRAIETLDELEDKSAIPALEALRSDRKGVVRCAALMAAERLTKLKAKDAA